MSTKSELNASSSYIQLSHRQLDCARLLLMGMKYKEIANKLGLSSRTIEFYIENLKTKLQCQNKTELIIRLMGLSHAVIEQADSHVREGSKK